VQLHLSLQILKPKQLPHKRVQPLTQRKLQFKP
jgi:hypothetical protein